MENKSLPAMCAVALAFSIVAPVARIAAADPAPWCNARRNDASDDYLKRYPDFEKQCFAIGMGLLDEAAGNDVNLREAEGIFETLLRRFPEGAYSLIGYAELDMRKRELGLDAAPIGRIRQMAERATRVRSVIPQAYVTLAKIDLLLGCLPCAEESARRARGLAVGGAELSILESLIAELRGNKNLAKAQLVDALRAPDLRPAARLRVRTALYAHYVRTGEISDAERELEDAIAEAPRNVAVLVRRAEFFLYVRGDPDRATTAAANANAVTVTLTAKRVSAIAGYLAWARDHLAGRQGDIKRMAQTSIVAADEAFVIGARYVSLSSICEALLGTGVVRGLEARDAAGNTALLAAAIGGNRKVARDLLARRAAINVQNQNGERPLLWFIQNDDHETALMLLKAGGEIDFVDNDGKSPLSVAVQRRDSKMVTELLKRKPKLSDAVLAGDLLLSAALMGDVPTMKALLNNGVKADSPGRSGSALVVAVTWGNKAAVTLLLEHGADPRHAMDAARESGNGEVLRILQAAIRPSI